MLDNLEEHHQLRTSSLEQTDPWRGIYLTWFVSVTDTYSL